MKDLFNIFREIRSFEKRTITMYGPPSAHEVYKYFTKHHPTYKIIPNKTIGVALIELPSQFEIYLAGSPMENMRYARKRAQKSGYVFKSARSMDHRDDILVINRSAEVRTDGEMHPEYLNAQQVDEYLAHNPELYGVFDKDNHLRAYIHTTLLGEVCLIARILGHKQFLNDGIMYLLVSELVKELITSYPEVKYLMFDTMIGASPGLRFFKKRLGFIPFRVKWKWKTTHYLNK
jgi:hypothetical protein